MLNLYVVPKCNNPVYIDADKRAQVIELLTRMGILGRASSADEYGPGLEVAKLFHSDALQHFCPGELTFESFKLESHQRSYFLPRDPALGMFDGTKCALCEDELEPHSLDLAFDKLSLFPVASVRYECLSCCTEVPFAELTFVQNIAVAHTWLFFEGLAFGRLNPMVLEHLSKLFNFPLTLVNEVPDYSERSWDDAKGTPY
jgi:hypothetical protein